MAMNSPFPPIPLQIQLNGRTHSLSAPASISTLLESLELAGKPVVVEVDHQPVLPRNYPTAILHQGSQVEIVAIAAGG